MKVTQLLTKTSKTAPADEQAKNAQLLIKAGYIHKEMAGVYDYLPLGYMVLNNIMQVIREEMNAIGGQELYLSALQPKENWETSGRWHDDVVDVWFKTRMHAGEGFHTGPELGLGNTHEEALTALMRSHIQSYKDLPKYAYQFQTKFRNELRSKSGIMRCREFIMKDLYSFCRNQKEHDAFYEQAKQAYIRIFERLGLGNLTYVTFASGGSFSKFSHEYQTITDIGEDTIYVHEGRRIAINKEVYTDEVLADLGVSKGELVEKRAVEVGNIFTLGTRFSEPLNLTFTDEDGTNKPVIMGSYGIGPGRVMGTIVEHFADERGIVWPKEIAPFRVYLVSLGGSAEVEQETDVLNKHLTDAGIGVLYDDRKATSAGEKFADADLLGIPFRVVISEKTVAAKKYELKARMAQETKLLSLEELIRTVK
ncbi:MAG TPA: aminoacyl--tRNA ligase-related protein [Candidatus Saccharimonadales bacterium]|nr:aminoacyl--tRNA ligase-related protein [Candidatus Saccharimonadales bacterium]